MSALLGSVVVTISAAAAHPSIVRAKNPAPNAYIVELDANTLAANNADDLTRSVGAKLGHVYDVVTNGFSIRGTEQQAVALATHR